MTIKWTYALVAALSLGVAACGGGGSSSDAPRGGNGGGGSGGGGQDRIPQNLRQVYSDLGMTPANLSGNMQIDPGLEPAVAAGYLSLSALVATMDLRMSLQSYEWFLPNTARAVGPLPFPGDETQPYPRRQAASCDHGGQAALFYWEDSDGSASLSVGEELLFGFGDCVAAGGSYALSSDGVDVPVPRVQRFVLLLPEERSLPYSSFRLDGVQVANYPGFSVNGGPLVRHTVDPLALDMVLSNAAPGEAPGTFVISGSGASGPVVVRIPGADQGVDTPMLIRSYKPSGVEGNNMLFDISNLRLRLERTGVESQYAGEYSVSAEAMDLRYKNDDGGANLEILSGGFSVQGPNGAVYSYALSADPAYLDVDIDADGDGTAEVGGRIPQALVVNRMRLPQ